MSPEKDEIPVCGYIYMYFIPNIYIYIYIYIYTSLFIFVPKFHMGTYLTFDNRLANGVT